MKPTKPSSTLPSSFGGTKTAFTQAEIDSGFQESIPEVLAGDNLNYLIDGIGENVNYAKQVADVLVDMPIGKVLTVNSNNQFEYGDGYANTNLDNLTSNELSGSVINLAQGFFYHTITENTQYILPEPIAGAVNEIEVYINMSEVFAIDLGTSNFVNGEPLELNVVGSYTLIWFYDFTKNVWVVGGFKNGS